MINKIINFFSELYHRSSIRYTVFISFTLSALIAVIMTGFTFYARFSNQLETTLHGENQILIEQINQSLYNYLSDMIRLADSINYQVIKNMDVSELSIYEQLQLLYDVNNIYVKNISLFSSEGNLVSTAPASILKEDVDVTEMSWFSEAMSRTENLHFSTPYVQNIFVDSESSYNWVISLSCAAEITENKAASTGVLLIELKYSGINELFTNTKLASGGYIYLVDGDGTIIYHPRYQLIATGAAEENSLATAGYRDGSYVLKDGGKSSVIVRSVGYTGWKIIGVIPQQGLSFDRMQNILYVLVIIFVYITIIFVVNSTISDKLTVPIKNLEQSVREIENGVSDLRIYIDGAYEVQQLGMSIQNMVDTMRRLTNDIVEEQIQKQKSELNALQAQINPHFLYNTLDIIVWMIEKGQPEDALTVVSALARFFRLSLSKGKNITTVKDELDHVKNYLMIQQMRYKNKFEYKFDVDENTLNLGTIKLVLQPIVENAIYHSMEFMDGDGEIVISAKASGDDLYLSVRDNGLGMTPETVDRLLVENVPVSKGSGVGLKNVHERIMLYFGQEYRVIIESEPDEGTCITLHLPAVSFEEMEGLE